MDISYSTASISTQPTVLTEGQQNMRFNPSENTQSNTTANPMNDGGVVIALAELFHKLQTGQSYGDSPQPHQYLNSYGQPLGVTCSQIGSGLEINGYARNNREQMAVNIISKHDRGRYLEARMKRNAMSQ